MLTLVNKSFPKLLVSFNFYHRLQIVSVVSLEVTGSLCSFSSLVSFHSKNPSLINHSFPVFFFKEKEHGASWEKQLARGSQFSHTSAFPPDRHHT